jgi:hypothetical protein
MPRVEAATTSTTTAKVKRAALWFDPTVRFFFVLTHIYRRAAAAEAQVIGILRNKTKAALNKFSST